MTDTLQTTAGRKLPRLVLTLHIELGEANYCFITCDQHRGLLLAESTIAQGLSKVVPALRELLSVGPSHPDPKAFDGINEIVKP